MIDKCQAVYDFQAEEEGDLAFSLGDVIDVISKDGEWWTGRLGEKEGIFPANYVTTYGPQRQVCPLTSIASSPRDAHSQTLQCT